MSSHVHLVFRGINKQKPDLLIGDLKRFTSNSIIRAIKENLKESKKEILSDYFLKEGTKSSNVNKYQFGWHDTKPVKLWTNKVISQKINYIH
ncbi:hypothetical protein [Chryseobacterium phosphatilyticum]|uniref:hypothetical protein n=1 Tax=Chryseobacterium phosphatilyticum TaxID=475075 RepID=UPI0016288214|nr:hypothetical protein [Chryseobacterium phosphatilyticum]